MCKIKQNLTRENIYYQLTGLGMQLRYLTNALMCTFMEVPVSYFFELRGNMPVAVEDRMLYLENMVSRIDVEFFKEAKSQIFNTNDRELAAKFCELDLVVWQLVMLGTRYEGEHSTVEHIVEKAGELLQLVYFLKTEMLHEEFFEFNASESVKTRALLERIVTERTGEQSADKMYGGWSQLEDAVKACDERTKAFADGVQILNDGTFEPKSALSPEDVKRLYLFLGEHRTVRGPKNDIGVIDTTKISLSQFEYALWHGCFTEIFECGSVRKEKFCFFITHFSKAYIKDCNGYRNRAARSLNLSPSQLSKFTKYDDFAAGLQQVLPLVKYNNT